MTEADEKMVKEVKEISKNGDNAEVKMSHDGKWVVYQVTKKKKEIN